MIDGAVVAAYLAVVLAVGWRARKGSPEAYWVAERKYGPLPVAASLVATIFGASSTVGIIGLGYARGLTGAWWALVGGLALIPFGLVLAPRVRRLEVYTLPDILQRAYGDRVAIPGATMIAVAWCGVVGAQIVAGALLLEGVFGMPFQAAVALVAVVFTLYTFWGGQLSVIRTDAWQLGLFVGGLLVTLLLVARALAGGPALADAVPPGFLDFPVSDRFGWYEVLVFYPIVVGLPYLVGPDIYSRVLCARDGDAARRAALLGAVVVVPLSLVLALLGLMIRAHLPDLAPESALPSAVGSLAPEGLAGLIVAGLLGAIMSSADTTLVSASTILSLNVATPWLDRAVAAGGPQAAPAGPEAGGAPGEDPGAAAPISPAAQLRATRLFVVLIGAVAWLVAATQEGIIASLLLAYTVFVGGVVLPTLASFWRERLGVTSTAAMWSVILGGGTAILGELGDGAALRALVGEGGVALLETALGAEYGSLLAVLVSAAALLGVSRVTR